MGSTTRPEKREIKMGRYILIDSNTGNIFGDSADFAADYREDLTPVEAARLLDESIGERGRVYTLMNSNPRTSATGYDVYRADVGGSDAVPVVYDGQDRETIDAVERDCEYVGFVLADGGEDWRAWIDGDEDNAVTFRVPLDAGVDIAFAGACALGVDVSENLNVARV